MTKPTNVLSDPSLRAVAKRRSQERGLSLSAYIRELIRADDAASSGVTGDITPLIGLLGNQGTPTDIARDKRELVAQALAEEFERKHQARRTAG